MNAITLKWEGIDLHANRDAWFNATEIAEAHGKEVYDWLRLSETKRYIAALCRLETDKEAELKPGKSRIYTTASFVKTRRGKYGGTWLHPDLMVCFARWISIEFEVWCDQTIKRLLTERPAWQVARAESNICAQVMAEILQTTRAAAGKETRAYHFSNEALLCNEALTGRREALPRDNLPAPALRMLIRLEAANAALIAHDKPYHERKVHLQGMAAPIRLRYYTEALQ
ncbi:KilA-N domain-containing protein [Cardiobacterium hominis]|uniref:KilA-N domain-containing protein n=1 Tax=Cardiobacterium hominis TaxID=2718 RepID=UPI0028E90085|nr:KilA-N domain-containing protein [Cardiobacterium hominis]